MHVHLGSGLLANTVHCCRCSVIPRVKYSGADAMYCAKFIKCMHEMHTAGFSSIQCYDKVPRSRTSATC